MSTLTKIPVTSAELGTLWMTYQTKSMMQRLIEYFIEKTNDDNAKEILSTYYNDTKNVILEIENIFNNESAVIPTGFNEHDVNINTPPLFDDFFHIMFLRMFVKVNLGINTIHLGLSFRKDIREFFVNNLTMNQKTFNMCTDYLLENGVLARAPHITMPKEIEFIEDKNYMSGFNLFSDKRSLNTIELGFLFDSIENNVIGMQLMTGFAQVAKESEVRDYFIKGKELAKKIISDFNSTLLQSDIQSPSTWAGKATDSTVPPFSDKLMMFCSNFMSNSSLGLNGLGTSFSLRSDLPAKLLIISKDIYNFSKEGGQIMIKHKWMEEPPQMEDRNQLTKSKK